MRVKDLRAALVGVDDEMVVLLRVGSEDGDQMMCSPSSANPDPGCSDHEAFVIDGTDGECEHEIPADGCLECRAEQERVQ